MGRPRSRYARADDFGEHADRRSRAAHGLQVYATITLSLSFAIGLFFLFPAAVAHLAESRFGWSLWWGNVAEGVVRLSLLVVYLYAVGFLPNIRRVFAYHGAEHQTINAFEAGAALTPETVATFPLEHTRCGTSFLLMLVLTSIVLFSFLGPMPCLAIIPVPLLSGLRPVKPS